MFLFTEVPLGDRPASAAAAGFAAIELWWPFAGPDPAREEVDALIGRLDDAGTRLACCNLYSGDVAAGERGVLSAPGRDEDFGASVAVAARLAERAGCRVFNALYGNRLDGVTVAEQDGFTLASLRLASEVLAPFGAQVVLEALNPAENPAYALPSSADTRRVVELARSAGLDNVSLLVDLYQYARIGEQPAAVLARAKGAIGHVQIADVPDRHEPGSGELGVVGLIEPLRAASWDGWVGLEYRPTTTTLESLSWLGGADLAMWPAKQPR